MKKTSFPNGKSCPKKKRQRRHLVTFYRHSEDSSDDEYFFRNRNAGSRNDARSRAREALMDLTWGRIYERINRDRSSANESDISSDKTDNLQDTVEHFDPIGPVDSENKYIQAVIEHNPHTDSSTVSNYSI